MLSYLSKEQNEAIQKSVARGVALKNAKEAREKARREAAVLREERAKERARGRAEKLKEKQQAKEEKEKTKAEKLEAERQKKGEKVRYVEKSGSVYYGIPRKIMNLTGWKLYTRFAYTPDREKHVLVLEESKEPTVHQITLCSSGCITINRNTCHEVGWKAGDTILVKHEGMKIIMRRVI
jgi:hypothetical protein